VVRGVPRRAVGRPTGGPPRATAKGEPAATLPELGYATSRSAEGLIEQIPGPDSSIDVVVSNGVLNLSTRKSPCAGRGLPGPPPGREDLDHDLVLEEALPEDILKSPAALAG
jgi:arsenite methyltransferase